MAAFSRGLAVKAVPERIFKTVTDDDRISAVSVSKVIKMQQLDTLFLFREYRERFFKDTNLKEYVILYRHTIILRSKCSGAEKSGFGGLNPGTNIHKIVFGTALKWCCLYFVYIFPFALMRIVHNLTNFRAN